MFASFTNRPLKFVASGIMMAALVATPALAFQGTDDPVSPTASPVESPHLSPTPTSEFHRPSPTFSHVVESGSPSPRPSGSPEHSGRLDDSHRHFCQMHHDEALGIMGRLNNRGAGFLTLFNNIATRTEAFYVAKGNTLTGYADLVAAVDAAKAKATADLATLKAHATLDCSSSDPKGSVSTFKTDAQQFIADIKAYRTALKALIAGVRSVNPAPSPSPSASPDGSN